MAINFANVNISLTEFQRISRGEFNAEFVGDRPCKASGFVGDRPLISWGQTPISCEICGGQTL